LLSAIWKHNPAKDMVDAKPPTLYRDSGIERSININEHSSQRQIALHDYYDIDNTADIILKYDFKRVIQNFKLFLH